MVAELRDLALFVAVVTEGSITAGAHQLDLSLSAASTRISALEREHGLTLLHRGRRGVSPTHAGRVLAEHASRVLAESAELERKLAAHGKGLRYEIRLASNSSAVDTLTEFLAAALARFPQTTVVLSEASSPRAVELVATRAADIAVVSACPAGDGFEAYPLWDDPLVVIGMRPDQLPRAEGKRAEVTLADVIRMPIVGLTAGKPLQELIEHKALDLGMTIAYRVRLPSLGAVCAVASTGAAPALVPLGTARRAGLPDSAIVPLADAWATRQAHLVARDFDELPRPVEQFVNALIRYGGEMAPRSAEHVDRLVRVERPRQLR